MIATQAVKKLIDDIATLALERADEWVQDGMAHETVHACLMIAARHAAADIAMTMAVDAIDPKEFIAGAAQIVAQQMAERALPIMDDYVAAIRKAEAKS